MAGQRAGKGSRGLPVACSAVTLLAVGLLCAPAGPVKLAGALILLGAFVWALGIAQRAGGAAIVPALGLALAFLVLIGLALAVFRALGRAPLAAAIGAVTLLAAWSSALDPAPGDLEQRTLERGTPGQRPHPVTVGGIVIFVTAAIFSVHYSVVSETADSAGASSLAVWAYPSGHQLHVGARQPPGRGPASLQITVTHGGITAAAWNDVHLSPGQTWRPPPLTMTGSGPATVVARRGGVVVARLSVS